MNSAPAARASQLGLSAISLAFVLGLPSLALAGPPPGGGGGPLGPGSAGQPPGDDKDGPAEAAPKDKQSLAPIVPVPAQPRSKRRLQLFEFHGYLRLRADYNHNFNLGVQPVTNGTTSDQATEFFRPPSFQGEGEVPDLTPNDVACTARKSGNSRAASRCGQKKGGFASANMRLRMEPTFHVSDSIRVHATIDALDNLVLGSTPELGGPTATMNVFQRSSVAPISGVNDFQDSLTVKRAWGHAHFGWGLDLKFGRMPLQWGLGVVFNDGNGIYRGQRDDIVRALDTDYGDSIDSVQFGYDFGKDRREQHQAFISYDWASTGPTASQLLGPGWASGAGVAQDFSVERLDNVHQIRLGIERRDSPDMLERKLSLGVPVVNYGAMAAFRFQTVDEAIASPEVSAADLADDPNALFDAYGANLVYRNAVIATPDLWVRVNWRTLRVELEAAGVFGKFNHRDLSGALSEDEIADLTIADLNKSTLLQMGYALEAKYGLFDDDLHIGFDHGFATGDDQPAVPFDASDPLTTFDGGERLTNFRFNPAYMQDLILFKELIGTAANAAYFKPWAAYHFFNGNFSARLDIEYALAHQKTATVGNRNNMGIEIDGAIRYHDVREPIFMQLQYGVMFPFGAFKGTTSNLAETASTEVNTSPAQAVQVQIGVRF